MADSQNIVSGFNLNTQHLSIVVIILGILQFITFGIIFVDGNFVVG